MNVSSEVFVDNYSDINNSTDNFDDDWKSKSKIWGLLFHALHFLAFLVSKLNKLNISSFSAVYKFILLIASALLYFPICKSPKAFRFYEIFFYRKV